MYCMENVKKIGIWGYGVIGKSAAQYFDRLGYQLAIMDKSLQSHDVQDLKKKNIAFTSEDHITDFLTRYDFILPSPGIDLRPYEQYKSKWLSQLDIFSQAWRKPIIAITGSIGKTTITHLLSLLLAQAGKKVATGGNIGTAVFDMLSQKEECELAVVEVSSFQLELTKEFAPDLAIWTNLYPNHLDRHGTQEEYFKVKAQLMAFQNESQYALMPLEFHNKVLTKAHISYFAKTQPTAAELQALPNSCAVYFFNESHVMVYKNSCYTTLFERTQLPLITFDENWLILCAALDILKIQLADFQSIELNLPEHRMEKVATINGVDFINDSKSTTAQSTLAAVQRLAHRPVLLLLGGKGKGVSRELLVKDLQGKVKKVYCFGVEAQELHSYCLSHNIASSATENLDQAFALITQETSPGDQVLLSPAGTSYDFYKIFSERGDHFKRLVEELKNTYI